MNDKYREMVQPGVMLFASTLNVVGSVIAVAIGAAEKNPFFYTSLTTSVLYAGANGFKVYEIATKKPTFVEREAERRNTVVELV